MLNHNLSINLSEVCWLKNITDLLSSNSRDHQSKVPSFCIFISQKFMIVVGFVILQQQTFFFCSPSIFHLEIFDYLRLEWDVFKTVAVIQNKKEWGQYRYRMKLFTWWATLYAISNYICQLYSSYSNQLNLILYKHTTVSSFVIFLSLSFVF